jgi:succinoglycan biosynthesis protein ExoH
MRQFQIDNAIKTRIAILRFVMIFGIVILHTPAYVNIADIGSGWFDLSKAFLQSAVFRCTVPVLTCLSGYLLFGSGIDRTLQKLARKKWRTLVLPFFACNVLLAALLYLLQSRFTVPISYQLYPFNMGTMLDAAFGYSKSPVNYPLNFLRDLLALMVLAPFLGYLLRNAAVPGLVLVILLFWFDFDSMLVLRNEMAIMFYIGGLAAVQQWDIKRLDNYAGACLVAFLALCAGIVLFKVANTTYLRFLAPFLLWPTTALLVDTRAGKWLAARAEHSFFIFLLHAPVLVLSYALYQQVEEHIAYPLYWFAAPVLTTWSLIVLHRFCTASRLPGFDGDFSAGKPKAT